jgi:Uma2 family endonuclease
MATQLRHFTADELLAMPHDGTRRELINGELREMTPIGRRHARIAMNVARALDAYVRSHALGEVYPELGYRLSAHPDTVRAPDVSFVRKSRLEEGGPEPGFFLGPPDLAVEVISPHDLYSDVAAKVDEYLTAGVVIVLVIDPPRRTVAVHRSRTEVAVLTEADVLDGGDVVPGWTLPVREIFT